jgi:hypothetical protein
MDQQKWQLQPDPVIIIPAVRPPADDVLGGGVRGEVTACPTGLAGLDPVPTPVQPTGDQS